MAELTEDGENKSALWRILMLPDLEPGSTPSYEGCKVIYTDHPLGSKMVDAPIAMAQSQHRDIAVPDGPEERVTEAFRQEWANIGADGHISNACSLARTYGVSSIVYGAVGRDTNAIINEWELSKLTLYFNILDPLNTSGSLVLNQDPNSPDFQKVVSVAVAGKPYHRSRACVMMNEKPIYISYSDSAFGYVGRSVYQRALFPMKSFIQSMITDDMVTQKAGLLVAKMKPAGSIVNGLMQRFAAVKRDLLKRGETRQVLSIDIAESIETLNMMNVDGAAGFARTNILKNIATAADMPAKLLENETLVEGFGEGTEDAKNIARYIDRTRIWMKPLYDFFDPIVMHRAWNEDFYAAIQAEFPDEYGAVPYKTAFMKWKNSFKAEWPNLLKEPDSEIAKSDKVKLDAIVELLETLMPKMDPENMAILVEWAADNFNSLKLLFPNPLELDYAALANYVPPEQQMADAAAEGEGDADEKKPPRPKAA